MALKMGPSRYRNWVSYATKWLPIFISFMTITNIKLILYTALFPLFYFSLLLYQSVECLTTSPPHTLGFHLYHPESSPSHR